MWQEESPWGTADDALPSSTLDLPRRPPSPLPSFASFTSSSKPVCSSTGGWADDGGWGASVDQSIVVTGGVASTSALTLDAEGEDTLGHGEVRRRSATVAVGKEEEEEDMGTPPTTRTNAEDESRYGGHDLTGIATATANGESPPLGFAKPSNTTTTQDHDTEPHNDTEAGGEGDDDGWGQHGASPVLPPIANLRVDDAEPDLDVPYKGWAGDDDGWVPPEVPDPLPTFGDVFGKPTTRRESVEEGWGGNDVVPSWNAGAGERDEGGAELDRKASEDGWGGEIDEADLDPEPEADPNRGNDETTAETIIRQASAVKDGLQKTAARTTETIQGSIAVAAIRNAGTTSFGRRTVSASEPSAAEESDGSTKAPVKSSWWGSKSTSDATATASNPSSPPPRIASPSTGQEEGAAPSRLGRLLGRLRRNPGASNEGPTASEPSADLPPEWKPRDLDALDPSRRSSPLQGGFSSRAAPLDDFFHDMPRKAIRVPTASPNDDFGLLGAFSQASSRPSSGSKKAPQAHDPFDPFADHDEPAVAAPPAFNMSRNGGVGASSFSSPSSFKMVSPPAKSSQSRVNSYVTNTSQRAGSPAVVAPRARAEQSEDSFDAFFDSVASANKKPALSTTSYEDFDLAMPKPQAGPKKTFAVPPPSILPRANLSRGPTLVSAAPPLRAASASPSFVNPLAPPPPPSQPLASRQLISELARPASSTGFTAQPRGASPAATTSALAPLLSPPPPPGMGVVPLAPSPVGSIKRSTGPAVKSPVPPLSQGPLSPDDFSFFES